MKTLSKKVRLCGAVIAVVFAFGCGPDAEPLGPCDTTYALMAHLSLGQILMPDPVLPGSIFEVNGQGFVPERSCVVPEVGLSRAQGSSEIEIPFETEVQTNNLLEATLPVAAADTLGGDGTFSGSLVVRFIAVDGSRVFASWVPISFPYSASLTPSASVLGQTEVYLNDPVILSGSSFLLGNEGVTDVEVAGTYTPDGGDPMTVPPVRIPAEPLEARDRSRTTFLWSSRIGGVTPGRFVGSVTPINAHADGTETRGQTMDGVDLPQQPTVLLTIGSDEVSLGQIADATGRGFIGPPDGTTVIQLDGTFRARETKAVSVQLVPTFVDGSKLHYPITVTSEGGYLHAVDFGSLRGEFVGTGTPILTTDTGTFEGMGRELTILLGAMTQVAWVRFIPGFSDSLELFGLGAVEQEIQRRVLERMQEIYCSADHPEDCINVEFRAVEPTDYYDGGYAIIDIGGPDPNNLGLFGYDATPGKDVHNLRLHDHVGGENALGALDSYPYGGVFIESLLFWSEHPPFSERPRAAPPSDPLFDQYFDAVRYAEVVAGEWPDGPDQDRAQQIEDAIHFLSSMIADTAAHEFGHSLGLAEPYSGDRVFHNQVPRDGCLMDAGRDRPLEERARLNGNQGALFCGGNLGYLKEILPME